MALIIKKSKNYSEEQQWEVLFEQIIKGNVIPVIGPDIVRIGMKTSTQDLLDSICDYCGIEEGEFSSFSQLVYDKRFKEAIPGENSIYPFIADIIQENADYFVQEEANELLYELLSIKYFPFVITTVFDPIVENTMRRIHGNQLRVMAFRNNASHNDDFANGDEKSVPTLYYMFGRAESKPKSFVVTDEDLLLFSQSWLRPNDSGNRAKPYVLSNLLSNRYLLVVGCDYKDWLFRFFWYAMKNDNFGSGKSGMLALKKEDRDLVGFLSRAKTFSRIEPDTKQFVKRLKEGILQKEQNYGLTKQLPPDEGTDVFLSYSRGDSKIAQMVYEVFMEKGLRVWYDRECLPYGQDFMRHIENAIRHSTFFIPLLTSTILEQAADEHPYRREWLCAVDHILNIGGISYCFPLLEQGFDIDDIRAAIPSELKRHNAFMFSKDTLREELVRMADYLLQQKEERKHYYGR